jgi:hypothetical protein
MATDWVSFVPSVVTGIVGLAGIGGATWQAKRSREAAAADLRGSLDAAAENLRLGIIADGERARLVERRRIYAEYLAAVNLNILAVTRLRDTLRKRKGEAEVDSMWIAVQDCVLASNNLRMALDLIASEDVIEHAIGISNFLNQIQDETLAGQTTEQGLWPRDLELLGNAMRSDLGEPSVDRFRIEEDD